MVGCSFVYRRSVSLWCEACCYIFIRTDRVSVTAASYCVKCMLQLVSMRKKNKILHGSRGAGRVPEEQR